MTALCIVPCGTKKVWDVNPTAGPTPARLVYVGVFASKCRQYAERFNPAAWCILSAKHGFLLPDDIVPGPYNVTFNRRKTKPISADRLAIQAMEKGLDKYDHIVVLGGRNYVLIANHVFGGARVHAPLGDCRGNGYMMQRLKAAMTLNIAL